MYSTYKLYGSSIKSMSIQGMATLKYGRINVTVQTLACRAPGVECQSLGPVLATTDLRLALERENRV